jgi:hypothetical protein
VVDAAAEQTRPRRRRKIPHIIVQRARVGQLGHRAVTDVLPHRHVEEAAHQGEGEQEQHRKSRKYAAPQVAP